MATEEATPKVEETPAHKPEAENTATSLDEFKDENGKIFGKFESEADLAKAYEESQKKITELSGEENQGEENQGEENQGENENENSGEESESPYDAGVTSVLENAGLNPQEVAEYYQENGDMSEEQYKALEEIGYSRDTVKAYNKAVDAANSETAAEATEVGAAVHEAVGGEETYSGMLEWAAENFTEAEAAEYNEAVESGNKTFATMAAKGLKAKYEAANGKKPKPLEKSGRQPKPDQFRSMNELRQAQKDSRYGKDPEYTQEVQAKAVRSDLFTHTTR